MTVGNCWVKNQKPEDSSEESDEIHKIEENNEDLNKFKIK